MVSWIAHELVPVVDRDLARDERCAATAAILDHLEQIATLAVAQWGQAPVIEDEQVGLRERLHQFSVGPIATRHGQLSEEARQPDIAYGEALTTGCMTKRTGQEGLPGARWADDQKRGVLTDPVPRCESHDEGAIESALGAEVHVLDTGGEAKACELEEPRKAAVLSRCTLSFQEEREPLLEGEPGEIGYAPLLLQRLGHPGEAERVQEVERLLGQHGRSPVAGGRASGSSSSASVTSCDVRGSSAR